MHSERMRTFSRGCDRFPRDCDECVHALCRSLRHCALNPNVGAYQTAKGDSNDCHLAFVRRERAACLPYAGARVQQGYANLARDVRSVLARTLLHAGPRPEMARKARTRHRTLGRMPPYGPATPVGLLSSAGLCPLSRKGSEWRVRDRRRTGVHAPVGSATLHPRTGGRLK